MAQLNFAMQNFYSPNRSIGLSNSILSFIPFLFVDYISFNTLNIQMRYASNSDSTGLLVWSIGLYSLTGQTLSLANSISRSTSQTTTNAVRFEYLSFSGISSAQNITPGIWYFGLLGSFDNITHNIIAHSSLNAFNAFPGFFIGGRMTVTTNALPASIATSNMDTTGNDAMQVPVIIISS